MPNPKQQRLDKLDALLPQTQCRDCGYEGCRPYATALVHENAPIDLCLPGGVDTLKAIAHVLNKDPNPFMEEMATKTKPRQVMVIREDECIGCTKCIQACPVDAIVGTGKWMHTIIETDCTGCELCISPCPVDCIDTRPLDKPWTRADQQKAKTQYQQRSARLLSLEQEKTRRYHEAKAPNAQDATSQQDTLAARKQRIAEAIARKKKPRDFKP